VRSQKDTSPKKAACCGPHHYCGRFNSLASQPRASVFIGSTGKETFSTRWQVEHSNVRSSKPRFPGEIRANPNLCLQVGHIGRTIVEAKLLTHPTECKPGLARYIMPIRTDKPSKIS
jgi:hypothetical protein